VTLENAFRDSHKRLWGVGEEGGDQTAGLKLRKAGNWNRGELERERGGRRPQKPGSREEKN